MVGLVSRIDPDRPRGAARALGAHYSPRPVVDFVVAQTLGALLRQRRWSARGDLPRICDPACGAGVFLQSVLEGLCRWMTRELGPDPAPGWLAERLPRCLLGVDVDPAAVQSARVALRQTALQWDPACEGLDLTRTIVEGNSLVSAGDGADQWRAVSFREQFPGGHEPGRFDLVVGNPPYVDAAEMARSDPELRRYLAERYHTAAGNWDLYCPFVERAAQLLSADGRLGLIVPNKLMSAGYARKTRQLLADLDLVLLRDYSRVRLFDAAVYPLVLIARRRPRQRQRRTLRVEVAAGSLDDCRIESRRAVPSAQAGHTAAAGWSSLLAPTARVSTPLGGLRGLGEVAQVVGAASVADAYALRPLVRECDHEAGCYRLINTGTIDPHRVLWGRRRLRYLRGSFEHPCVDADELERLLPRRAAQTRAPKIVVAGLARRLECVLDTGGLLAGKSTSLVLASENRFATDPGQPLDPTLDLALLLGLLNSAAASAMLRHQFGGLTLSGGYLRIGPPQLRELQIPDPATLSPALRQRIRTASAALTRLGAADTDPTDPRWQKHQSRIDEPTWPLFGLDPPAKT